MLEHVYRHFTNFSRGQWWAILFVTLLIIAIASLVLWHGVQPRTPDARFADILTGVCIAIFGVFVVGGTIEFKTKFVDQGVKATGGIALSLLVMWLWAPFYSADAVEKYNVNAEIPAYLTLDHIIERVRDERRADLTDVYFDFDGHEQIIRNLRTEPIDESVPFRGTDWANAFKEFARELPCLSVELDDDVVKFQLDRSAVEKSAEEESVHVCT